MGRIADFKALVKSGKPLSGTFLKTPHHNMIEVMAQSGLDFVCLDAEHAPFDRAAIDACMAVSRALDYPVLVRVGDSSPREILWALDCGAAGIVVPHVDSVERAEKLHAQLGLAKGAVDLRARRVGADLAPKKWPIFWNAHSKKLLCSPRSKKTMPCPYRIRLPQLTALMRYSRGPLILRSAWAIRQ